MRDLDVITPGVDTRDGCPILRRVQAFISAEGVAATLKWTFVDGDGDPVNLDNSFSEVSDSSAASEAAAEQVILVKFREFLGTSTAADECTSVIGTIVDAVSGVVTAQIPENIYAQCGLYEVGWGFVLENQLKYVQMTALSVERSLFGFSTFNRVRTEGPPTLNEIRMHMMDNPGDNPLLMGDVEFTSSQILQAIGHPIEYFNGTNPPITQKFDTRNFPWRFAWFDAIKGQLFGFAADWYRRNRLQITGGGKSLDPLNREKEYLQAAQLYEERWREFTLKKKVERNLAACVSEIDSDYSQWGR